MRFINKEDGKLNISEIIMGCMRIAGMEVNDVELLINKAIENKVNIFDHADIYGGGESESIFAKAYKGKREDIIIQTKCGIRKGSFDFSKEHILNSVDKSLKRLNTDYIDILLLHRPDTLMEPEEISEAFELLLKQGKVRHFGVSNQNPMQITLLSKYLKSKILFNQLQLSLTNTGMIDAGLNVNMQNQHTINRDGGILEFCRIHDITIQAWSPFQYGFFEGVFIDSPKYPELNKKLKELAEKYNVTKETIAVAWILRHPAKIQTVTGTTNITRFDNICKAANITLTREEWYELYISAGNILP